MCDYTQVEYACSHLRFTVRSWCTKYQETHRRCPPNVVAIEYRLGEKCGDCKDTSSAKYEFKKLSKSSDKKDDDAGPPGSANAATETSSSGSSQESS